MNWFLASKIDTENWKCPILYSILRNPKKSQRNTNEPKRKKQLLCLQLCYFGHANIFSSIILHLNAHPFSSTYPEMNHQRIDLGQPGAVFPRIMTLPVQIGPLFLITNLQSSDNLFKKWEFFYVRYENGIWTLTNSDQESSLEKIRLHAAVTLILIFQKTLIVGVCSNNCKLDY